MKIYQLAYQYLINHAKDRERTYWKSIWKKCVLPYTNKPVKIIIHEKEVTVNCGYLYPVFMRVFTKLNNPLLQLAYQTRMDCNRPITCVDAGAAIGDTFLLLDSNIDQLFERVLCIDGDSEFYNYLAENMKDISYADVCNALLSDEDESEVANLQRIHSGTASSQGKNKVRSFRLDSIAASLKYLSIDLLKIDVDGFDGKVLAGASDILSLYRPHVIFEWHPLLIKKTGNDIHLAFSQLQKAGYETFLFFTKYGKFSHYMLKNDVPEIELLSMLSEHGIYEIDWHYDVIALHKEARLNIIELAECNFAKKKRSAY